MGPTAAFKRQGYASKYLNHKFIALAAEVSRVVVVDAADDIHGLVAGFALIFVTRQLRSP